MVGSKIGKEVRKGDFLRTASFTKPSCVYDLKGFATDSYSGVPKYQFGSDAKSRSFKAGIPGPG